MKLRFPIRPFTLMLAAIATSPMCLIRPNRNGSARSNHRVGLLDLLPGIILLVLITGADFCPLAGAADRSQARSMVITREGIAATEHPLASPIGAAILPGGA